MISSAEEFVRLRESERLDEYTRAAHEEAPLAVWLDVISRFPKMKQWVAHNKSIPLEVLRLLATDEDPNVRFSVAMKRKLDGALFELLSNDADDGVRARVAANKNAPTDVLERLCDDRSELVRNTARERRAAAMKDMTNVSLSEGAPTVAEYIALRQQIGWGVIDEETARRTIEGACYTVCLRREGRLVGLVRLIGDGCLYFAFSDVIVSPELQGGGHGARMMRAATDYLRRAAKPGASITLQPLAGREPFYEKFGFVRCPSGPFGQGMVFADAPPPVGGSFG